MATAEVVEIHSGSSDDEFEEPPRKPIGWNYQLATSKAAKAKPRPNGASPATTPASAPVSCRSVKEASSETTTASMPVSRRFVKESSAATAPTSTSTSVSHCLVKEASAATAPVSTVSWPSVKEADDDLEIIEVKVEPKSRHASLPLSSSRSEIRKQVRGAIQSSVFDFFSNKTKGIEDTKENGSRKENKTKTHANNPTDKGRLKKELEEEEEDNDKSAARMEEEEDKSASRMEEFMRRWEEIKVSKDDEKIRDKLWKHYHLAQTSYTHSKKFIQIVEVSTRKLTVDNIYVVIKDILDCLKQYKDIPYREKESGEESAGVSREGTPAPIETENNKINSRLKKVEKKMKELADKIKMLENEDVDLDDDDNSSYLVEDRLKRQFAKLHDYYCRIANCSPAIGRPIERKFKFRGSKWMEINKRISAWVNKHKEFPDYVDILNLVKKVTKQSSLPLRPETVRVQAQEIFRDVGRMLKDRRESDDLYSIYSYVEDEEEEDPATKDEALNRKLNENDKIATDNLEKVFQEYVIKDAQQNEKTSKAPTQQDSPVKDPVRIAECQEKTSSLVKDPVRTVECQEGTSSPVEDPLRIAECQEETNSPVKDPLRTTECQKEETSMTKGVNNVREDLRGELPVMMKDGSDNCIENDRNAENDDDEEEDTISDTEEDEEDTPSDDDDDSSVEEIEDERQDMQEQSTHERAKIEEELDDGDETDEDLKVVLASACMEEEEEDSEEDIPVIGTEELLELDGSSGESSSKNSVLCLDDDSQEFTTNTSGTPNNCNEELSITTTSSPVASESPQKRSQEENLPPCKRLCI